MHIKLYGYVGYLGSDRVTTFYPYFNRDFAYYGGTCFDGTYYVEFSDDAGISFSKNSVGEFFVEFLKPGLRDVYLLTDVLRSVDDEPVILIPSPIGKVRYIKPVKVDRVEAEEYHK